MRDGEGWPFYARPRRGSTPTAEDVELARRVLREAAAPESVEWIDDVSPGMREAAAANGLRVSDHPLMVYRGGNLAIGGASARLATPEDDLATFAAVAAVGFAHPGTAVGAAGSAELAVHVGPPDDAERERLRSGALTRAVAFLDGRPVATGVHQPLDGVTEIAGIATLPSARRRGFGRAVTALLVDDAIRRGAELVFLSAGSAEIARVYASLGFERIGTACIAGPAA